MNVQILNFIIYQAMKSGTPLLLATLGEIYAERAGILNLGIEGMMAFGAVVGFGVAYTTGNPWLGLLLGALAGALISVIHAFFSISLRVNQVVSGLALVILGLGIHSVMGKPYVGQKLSNTITGIISPSLAQIPVVGAIIVQDPIAFLGLALSVVLWYVLFKTKYGIILRSVGENPAAADALGINVYKVRYLATIFGGLMAGLAGAYLSIIFRPSWTEGITAGMGWIAIALTIFSLWNPIHALWASYFFSAISASQYLLQGEGIHVDILGMMPYIFTLVIVVIASLTQLKKRIGAPEALAVPYVRGQS